MMSDSKKDNLDPKQPSRALKPVAFWQLYKNPIFLRYLRSRMRWGRLSASLILTLILTTFVFLIAYNSTSWVHPKIVEITVTSEEAYRATFLPIFLIQIIIMMFMGTGAVAGGISQEYEDGMVDYQRLTPMSPLAKIIGYLFGLPIREWFLLGVTSIAIIIIVKGGNIPMESVWRVYSVFFLSIMLYHLLALVVVHSMKRKRIAGRVIQMLVILLYIVFPMLSQFGIVFFEYLTVRPILKEHMLEFLPEENFFTQLIGVDGDDARVPFFNRYLEAWSFAVMLQASLVVTFIVMLTRRWKDTSSHLMSKPFGVLFFAYFGFLLLGNTIPLAQRGEMTLSNKLIENRIDRIERRFNKNPSGSVENLKNQVEAIRQSQKPYQAAELALTQTLFFAVSAMLGCLIVFICTPRLSKYLVGLRRSRNFKKKWMPPHWDEALGLVTASIITILLCLALYEFSITLFTGNAVPSPVRMLVPFIPYVVFYGGLCVLTFYMVYEAWENRGLFLLILFVWILPLMVAMVMLVLKMPQSSIVWVSCASPVAGYTYGMYVDSVLPTREAFFFSMLIQIIILAVASIFLLKNKVSRGRALKAV